MERFYNQLLSRESLSCVEGRGVFAYQFTPEHRADSDDDFEDDYWSLPESPVLQLLVRPQREPALNPLVFELMVRSQLEQVLGEQGGFPKPRAVGAFYEMLLGLGYRPRGRGGGGPHKAQKLVLQCVGCLLMGQQVLLAETDKDERRRWMAEMNQLVKRYVTEPRAIEIPVESRRIQYRDLKPVYQQIEYIVGEIQKHSTFLLNKTS